jgi:hypothetical protein
VVSEKQNSASSSSTSSSDRDKDEGIKLSDNMLEVYEGYLKAGDFDTAQDMLDVFRYNGIDARDINTCMYLMDYYYASFHTPKGTDSSGVIPTVPGKDKMNALK